MSGTTPGEHGARRGVRANVWLRAGADLLAVPLSNEAMTRWTDERAKQPADTAIDGALGLSVAGVSIIDDGVWDHLDGLLAAWREALAKLRAGGADAEALVRLPDTRLEVELQRDHAAVELWCEGRAAHASLAELTRAIAGACELLVRACAALPAAQRPRTDALRRITTADGEES